MSVSQKVWIKIFHDFHGNRLRVTWYTLDEFPPWRTAAARHQGHPADPKKQSDSMTLVKPYQW